MFYLQEKGGLISNTDICLMEFCTFMLLKECIALIVVFSHPSHDLSSWFQLAEINHNNCRPSVCIESLMGLQIMHFSVTALAVSFQLFTKCGN